MTDPLSTIELEVIEYGEDDWVLFAQIVDIINASSETFTTAEIIREQAQQVALALCGKGYARLGRYFNGKGFVPWEETPEELRNRLQKELTNPPAGESHELNQMNIMLDVLPAGQDAKASQKG